VSKKPLVSIIINCFNGEKYLREAINSVIAQSYENWEIIFWDNKSTDKSAKIFQSYNDKRLRYFLAPFHTELLYEARNYALEKTAGDFIAFLDTDDWWLPDKLEKQLPLFEDSEVGLVYGNSWMVFEKKNKKIIYRKKSLPTGMILNELFEDYVISSPTYIIRKTALKSLKYNFNKNFHIIGDFDLNTRLAATWKSNCIQSPVAFVRIHGKNESLLNRSREIEELKSWYNEKKKDLFFSSQTNFYKIPLETSYLEIMQAILNKGFIKSSLMVIKYPLCFKKFKLIIALLLPRFVLNKIKNY
tara:strand:+ start:1214 stop:2116 length:903 start_codon:yes stop_codon:yes gene_type:complete